MSQEPHPGLSERHAELTELITSSAREANAEVIRINEQITTLDRLGELAISGVSIEDDARENLEARKLIAENDATILGAIAVQADPTYEVAPRTNGSHPIAEQEEPEEPSPQDEPPQAGGNGSAPEKAKTGEMTKTSKITAGKIIKTLIDKGGAIEVEGSDSAANILIEEIEGLTRNSWIGLKAHLTQMEVINLEKTTPTARRFKRIEVNADVAIKLAEAGELPEDLVGYIEEARKKAEESGETPSFLAGSR